MLIIGIDELTKMYNNPLYSYVFSKLTDNKLVLAGDFFHVEA